MPERETITVPAANGHATPPVVYRSSHLEFRHHRSGRIAAYHRLFGNLAWIDADLLRFLRDIDGPIDFTRVVAVLGEATAEILYNSYFLTNQSDEERLLTDEWLDDRRRNAPTGYFLGGLQI